MTEPGRNALDAWTTAVRDELGLDDDAQVGLVLRVAKEVAHGVLRPAAPVTTYLLGLAVGRGADPAEAAAVISRLVTERASDGEASGD